VDWTLATGSTLEDRPVYVKTTCFEPFPHEDTGLTPELADRIRSLGEQLDAHRKARQAAFESVTLTGLYNVLDKLRRGEPLSAKDKTLHEQGLVSVLQSLHDELDAAVLQAYGWSDLGPVPGSNETARAAWTETLLERLVALNAQRAAQEAAGTVRWLRPEFQDPVRRAAALAAADQVADPAAEAGAPAATAMPQQTGIDGVESKADAATRAAQALAADTAEATDAAQGETGAAATLQATTAPTAQQPARAGARRGLAAQRQPRAAATARHRSQLQRQRPLEERPAPHSGNPGRPGPRTARGRWLARVSLSGVTALHTRRGVSHPCACKRPKRNRRKPPGAHLV